MRHILVTGANKGIGFAIAKGALRAQPDAFVWLGSRDAARGEAAVKTLVEGDPASANRVRSLAIDVADDASVRAAAERLQSELGEDRLYAVVNNAGIGTAREGMRAVLNVNTRGVARVCSALLPLLDRERGRIVNVTSAAGPNFVAECSEERKRFFLDANTEWQDLEALMEECLAIEGDQAAFRARGLGDGNPYGLSKACANTYTLQLARRHPQLAINACTPGFIETDMTRALAASQGKSPADFGMKPPDEGAKTPLALLFGELEGNGRYYGSDGLRSPLDRYRAPGSPPYTGR